MKEVEHKKYSKRRQERTKENRTDMTKQVKMVAPLLVITLNAAGPSDVIKRKNC